MRVTARTCINGKPHRWVHMYAIKLEYGSHKFSWCKKCGCVCEHSKGNDEKRWKRCVNKKGETFIRIPGILKEEAHEKIEV